MASEGSVSRMPSGLLARSAAPKSGASEPNPSSYPDSSNGGSSLPLILAIIALLLGAASLYVSLSAPHGLTADDRAQLTAITADLRAIQQKEITLTTPLKTTVSIDQSFPASDLFPSNFALPISLTLPINTTVTAQSNTGQLVPLHIDDSINVRTSIPMDVNKSLAGVPITISKDIPINTQFSVNLKVSAVYGKELNDLINRLDALSQTGGTASSG